MKSTFWMTAQQAEDETKSREAVVKPKRPTIRIKLVCQECGRKFLVSPNAADPACPKCGSVDWEVL